MLSRMMATALFAPGAVSLVQYLVREAQVALNNADPDGDDLNAESQINAITKQLGAFVSMFFTGEDRGEDAAAFPSVANGGRSLIPRVRLLLLLLIMMLLLLLLFGDC